MDFVNCPEDILHIGKYTTEDIFIRFAFTIFLYISVHNLRLDGVKYENGQISVVQKKTGNRPRFYLKKWCVMSCKKCKKNTVCHPLLLLVINNVLIS